MAYKWEKKFIRPMETRWMVGLEGCVLLDERWDDLFWLCKDWAGHDLVKGAFTKYWLKSAILLSTPRIHLQVKFAR